MVEFSLGILNFLLLVRLLAVQDFGAWAIFISIAAIAESFRAGLLQNAFIRYYNVAITNRLKDLLGNTFSMNVGMAVVYAAAMVFLGQQLFTVLNLPNLQPARVALALILLASAPVFQVSLYLLAELRMKNYFQTQIIRPILFSIGVVLHFFFDLKLDLTLLSIYYISAAIIASYVSILLFQKQAVPRLGWDVNVFKKLYLFGRYVFVTNTLSTTKQNIDKFILSALLGPVSVAISNVAFRFINVFEIPLQSIALVYYSKVTRSISRDDTEKQGAFFYTNLAIILALTIPVAGMIWFFAPELTVFFAGEAYAKSAIFLRIIIFSALVKPLDKLAGSYLDGAGFPHKNTWSVAITFGLSLPLFYFLIVKYQLIGAAYGFLLSQFISTAIKIYLLRASFNFSPTKVWKTLLDLARQSKTPVDP